MSKLKAPSRMTMALPRFFSPLYLTVFLAGCAAAIHDGPLCSPIPTEPGQCRGSQGAACDNFLKRAPRDLDARQWEAEQASWEASGCVVEETNSCFTSQLKAEIEKLCTLATCTEAQQNQVKAIGQNFLRLKRVAERARNRARAHGLAFPEEVNTPVQTSEE